MDDHTINCEIKNVLTKMNVAWSTTSATAFAFNKNDGVHNKADNSQTSTLSFSSSQLAALKTAGGKNPAHTFTCKITVGPTNTEFKAMQTMNIYAPGDYDYKLFGYLSLISLYERFPTILCLCANLKF